MLLKIHGRLLLNDCTSVVRYRVQRYTAALTDASTTSDVHYPPIQDLSRSAVKKRELEKWHRKVRSLRTVEEKLFELNMPRYYGWRSVLLEEHSVHYNSLNFAQYITRTHVVNDSQLPGPYDNLVPSEQLEQVTESIRNEIQDNILFEFASARKREETERHSHAFVDTAQLEDNIAQSLTRQINRTIINNLSSEYSHLSEAMIDYNPRTEAFWFVGGIEPIAAVKKSRAGLPWCKGYIDEPIDRPFQYIGSPVLHVRHELPLPEIVPHSDSENPAFTVPEYKLDPRTIGYTTIRRHATSIPGFWPGDPCEFGLLSYHSRGNIFEIAKGRDDKLEALSAQALLASYSWLLSQACYQGFSTFDDITYPLITQAILTDGQWWSFCVYQLNTTLVHGELATNNPRRNLCWITKPMRLFEKVDVGSGLVHGLDKDVLKSLLKFYMNAPRERPDVAMKPYLGESVQVLADIAEDERRKWLEKYYKHLVSVRPRHRRIPEIYHWQKIYMIDNKTRPIEKRREFWQFGIDLFKRRLDDHTPQYIPRKLRERPNKRKYGRWEKTYYP